jgi:hypothetical protein
LAESGHATAPSLFAMKRGRSPPRKKTNDGKLCQQRAVDTKTIIAQSEILDVVQEFRDELRMTVRTKHILI